LRLTHKVPFAPICRIHENLFLPVQDEIDAND
jgi:hypothetical protein